MFREPWDSSNFMFDRTDPWRGQQFENEAGLLMAFVKLLWHFTVKVIIGIVLLVLTAAALGAFTHV